MWEKENLAKSKAFPEKHFSSYSDPAQSVINIQTLKECRIFSKSSRSFSDINGEVPDFLYSRSAAVKKILKFAYAFVEFMFTIFSGQCIPVLSRNGLRKLWERFYIIPRNELAREKHWTIQMDCERGEEAAVQVIFIDFRSFRNKLRKLEIFLKFGWNRKTFSRYVYRNTTPSTMICL